MDNSIDSPTKLYTSTFWILCLNFGLSGGSFYRIILKPPSFLTNLYGAHDQGLTIAFFTLTADLLRIFSGKLNNLIGRKPIITSIFTLCAYLFYEELKRVKE